MLPDAHLTIDGHPIPMEDDWQASSTAEGGYERFSARVPLSSIRRFSLGQESRAVLYLDSGEVAWWGTLVQDPQAEGEVARIEAEGPAADAEKEAGRLLYQSRDNGLWVDRQDAPFNITASVNNDMALDITDRLLRFILPRGEAFSTGDLQRAAVWAPGTPGGVTRVAGTFGGKNQSSSMEVLVVRFTGPGGISTTLSTISTPSGPFDVSTVFPEDGLGLYYRVTSGFTVGAKKTLRIQDLRVNGIWGNTGRAANRDIMYADEGAADVFTRLGWGISNTQINTNVLPQDHDGSYADLLSYLCELVDFCWLAPLVPGGTATFRPWGDRIHTVSDGGVFNLAKLRLHNKVVVPYESVTGAPLEAVTAPAVDLLPGVTREYVHDGLSDPQADGVLATSVAQTLADLLGVPRWAGTVDVVKTREGSPHLIRPGDLLREENAGPGESRTHRIWSVSLSRSGVSLGIEDRVSVEGLIELAALSKARKPFRRKKRKRKRKRKARR